MSRRAILHIGHPKTATSFLQHLMQLNAGALSKAGISVPSDFLAAGYHDYGALACAGAVYPGNAEPFFRALSAGRDLAVFDPWMPLSDDVILSSELFFYSPPLIRQLASYLGAKGFRTEIVAYVDRYDRMAVKAYCQNIRNHGFSGTLIDYLKATITERLLRYHEIHARLRAFSDIHRVEFRAFPARYLRGGRIEDDFFGALSKRLDIASFVRPRGVVNTTMSLVELEAARRLNRRGDTDAVGRLVARERIGDDGERERIRRYYFSHEARDFLVRELRDDRDAFAALMPAEQAELWQVETFPVEPVVLDEDEVERLVEWVAREPA